MNSDPCETLPGKHCISPPANDVDLYHCGMMSHEYMYTVTDCFVGMKSFIIYT